MPQECISPPSSPASVGGQLQCYAQRWESITSDAFTLSVVRNGYALKFDLCGPPKLSRVPIPFDPPREESLRKELTAAVDKLLQKGAIEPVEDLGSPGFYSRLFLVPKRDGGMRPVIDLSALNRSLLKEKFKMETAASISASLRREEYTTSIDLKDAYFHIPIARSSRKYLRFVVQGKAYQFKALPFGLAPAPLVFTKVMESVAAYVHRKGIRLHIYLDDWLICSLLEEQLWKDTRFVRELCSFLGLLVNVPKSNMVPQRDFVFLGIHFQTIPFLCRPSEDRWRRLTKLIRQFMRAKSLSARLWMRLIGTLTSMDSQVPLGRLYRRPIQFSFRNRWDRVRRSLVQRIAVLPIDRVRLQWWARRSNVMSGRSLRPFQTDLMLLTDASKSGWGAHMGSLSVSGVWPNPWRHFAINWLELEAIRLALLQFTHQVRNRDVLVMSDNKTAIAYLNKQGGVRSKRLFLLAKQTLLWCRGNQTRLLCRHIPGRLNVKADLLSRRQQVIGTEWSLHHSVVQSMWALWGRPLIDLFATRDNNKLPTFVSPYPDEMAFATDALAISWNGMWAYAYPPTQIIPAVLAKVKRDAVEMIMVAPWWPKKVWSLDLLELSLERPRALPIRRNLLAQPKSNIFHENPHVLRLHAWRLSRKALEMQGSQREWRKGLPEGGFEPLL